jgi:hypothetical protein
VEAHAEIGVFVDYLFWVQPARLSETTPTNPEAVAHRSHRIAYAGRLRGIASLQPFTPFYGITLRAPTPFQDA